MSWDLPFIPHPWDDIVAWIVLLSILLPAISVVWNRGIKRFWTMSRQLFRIVESVDKMNDHLASLVEVLPVIVEIGEQFKPDGGNTLHDQVSSLQQSHVDLIQQMERHLVDHHGG